jgi:hypothetical protein
VGTPSSPRIVAVLIFKKNVHARSCIARDLERTMLPENYPEDSRIFIASLVNEFWLRDIGDPLEYSYLRLV